MITGVKSLAAASVVGLVAGTTSADTVIDTIPDWDGNVSHGWTNIAQSFTVPEGDIVLNTFELGIRSLDGESYNLLLHAWDPIGDHAVGNALYDSGLLAAPGALTFIEFEIGVALAAGESYAIIVAWNNRGISSGVAFSFADQYDEGYNTYTDGSIFDPWKFGPDTDFEMAFRATFKIPTPATLAMLGAAGLVSRRRRRRS
ncbi:MAG: hypothetical protein V3T84_00500 [Phycisphaerales bacterium]